jgi:hypothetical protein
MEPRGKDRNFLVRSLLPPLLVGITACILFIAIMGSALKSPEPNGVPIALETGSPVLSGIAARAESFMPGAFLVKRYPSAPAARAALEDQQAYAALVLLPGPALLVTEATGFPTSVVVTQAFTGAAARTPLVVRDLAPFPVRDEEGLGAFFLVFGLTIAGLAFTIMLHIRARTVGRYTHLVVAAIFSLTAGLVGALTDDVLLGVVPGHFLAESVIGTIFAFCIVMVMRSLICLVGTTGIPLSVLWFVPVCVAASGGLVQYHFLPAFYRLISQAVPAGASVTMLLRTTYFGGRGISGPIVTLAVWAVAGTAAALGIPGLRDGRRQGR